MQHTIGAFKTTDGVNIHTEAWLPDGDVRAVVLMVHGLAEHIGRYAHIADRLTRDGYAFYGLDHRGHGKSDGLRAYFENFDQPLNDLKTYLDQVKAQNPGKKIFIYGHSLGSLITLNFVLRYPSEFAGMIISGTTLGVEGGQPKLLITMGEIMNNILPKLPVAPLDAKDLSHDPVAVTAYDTDPLIHRGNVRVRMANQIVQYSRHVREHLNQFKLPVLIIHGGEDKICPTPGSAILSQGIGSTDKTVKVYPGLYHEIHNEFEKETVLNDITNWLNQHT